MIIFVNTLKCFHSYNTLKENQVLFHKNSSMKKPYCFQSCNISWVCISIILGENTNTQNTGTYLLQNWRMSHKPKRYFCLVLIPFLLIQKKKLPFWFWTNLWGEFMCGLCGFIWKSLKASGQQKFNSIRIWLIAGSVFEVIGYIQNLGQTESTNIETETRWKKKCTLLSAGRVRPVFLVLAIYFYELSLCLWPSLPIYYLPLLILTDTSQHVTRESPVTVCMVCLETKWCS